MSNLLRMEREALDGAELEEGACRGMWLPTLTAEPIGVDHGHNMHISVRVAIPKGVLKEVDRASTLLVMSNGQPQGPNLQDALVMPPMLRLVIKAAAMTDEALASLDAHIAAEAKAQGGGEPQGEDEPV